MTELAVCGTNLKATATGLQLYALDHSRRCPHRAGVNDEDNDGAIRPYAYANWRDPSLVMIPPLGDLKMPTRD